MQHIVSFSTGLSSALTAERVLARHGATHTHIIVMDTLVEDDDNYRFAAEVERRWQSLYGLDRIKWLTDGRTPFQLMEDRSIIGNSRAAPCTFTLKLDPFYAYLASLDAPLTVYIGFDFREYHRVKATRAKYEAQGYTVDFPLLWKPIETRGYTEVVWADWGIEPPAMYDEGYSHANCGGCCVKQGIRDWALTYRQHPDRYAVAEAWERSMQARLGKPYTILRETVDGERVNLSLQALRERIEQSPQTEALSLFDDQGRVCGVECGIG